MRFRNKVFHRHLKMGIMAVEYFLYLKQSKNLLSNQLSQVNLDIQNLSLFNFYSSKTFNNVKKFQSIKVKSLLSVQHDLFLQ